MSQFDNPYADAGAVPQSTSKLAIWSLVCSLIFCCPLTTLLGPLLGLISLAKIGGNPLLKGRGLAVAGILIGLLATGGQVYLGYMAAPYIARSVELTTRGPQSALTSGFAGDIAGFKDWFHGAGAAASDAEAQAFIDELRSRYGAFQSATVSPSAQPPMFQPVYTLPFLATFDQATVTADTEIMASDPSTGQPVLAIVSITIVDADKGDLTYPAGP